MPPKTAPDHRPYQALRAALKSGTVGKLYVFYGEEAYLREHALREMKKLLLPEGLEEFNLHTLHGDDLSPEQIAEAVDCLPMMSERTLVVVNNFDLFGTEELRDAMAELLSDLPDYCCLVFVYDLIDYKPDGRYKLTSFLKNADALVGFHRQESSGLIKWMHQRFHALGREIDTEQCRYLIFLCGDLMHDLASEIAKIAAYAKQTRVTRADIDAVATPRLDAVVFHMTDAIMAGQFERALSILGNMISMNEPPIMILAVLGRQLRQLYAARLLHEADEGADALVKLWGMHPYPAGLMMKAVRTRTLSQCAAAVRRAFETDRAMKSSGMDARELLTNFVLTLAHERAGAT